MVKNLYTKLKELLANNPKIKKIIGIFLIILGLLALITPFTPGSWLAFIGLEFLGIRSFIKSKKI